MSYVDRFKGLVGRGMLNSNDVESTHDQDPNEYFEPPGPPNLQLNLSSDHFEKTLIRKRHELFLAAVFAVVLQVGLIAIAAVTVYHEGTRERINHEPEEHGFPSFVAGSVLLVFGMLLCSLAVEQSTTERSWKVVDSKTEELDYYPRLIWLQQSQTVSDQSFDPYAILAGPKKKIVTSSRIEDTQAKDDKSDPSSPEKDDDASSDTEDERVSCFTYPPGRLSHPQPSNQIIRHIEHRKEPRPGNSSPLSASLLRAVALWHSSSVSVHSHIRTRLLSLSAFS